MSTNRPPTNRHDVRVAWIKYTARVLYGVLALFATLVAKSAFWP